MNYRNNIADKVMAAPWGNGSVSGMGLHGFFTACGSMTSVIPAQPEPSNGVCRPRFFNCFWDIPTTLERYVHVTCKSLVGAVHLFDQSHGNVDIPAPFWCRNGVQNRACCPTPAASSFLIPVCADGAGRYRECRPSPPSDTPYSQDHSAQLWCRCQIFGECQRLFSL